MRCAGKPLKTQERKDMEVYEFVQNCPDKYVVYVSREVIPGAIATRKVTVTTADGAILGWGFLRVPYRNNGHLRYPLEFTAINGVRYKGLFYNNRNYANVRRVAAELIEKAREKETYRGYNIEPSGTNYRVRTIKGEYVFAELAATVETAKKWIDAHLIQKHARLTS